jgi:LPXTG-site transpeptidase (sortase) family protein
MYYRRSTRLPLTLAVLIISTIFGAAVVINQVQMSSPQNPGVDSTQITLTVLPSTLIPITETPDIKRYSLFVPSLGITARLIHLSISGGRWNVDGLASNVGHLTGTAWFEDVPTGNVVLAGHVEMRDGQPGIFARLHEVPLGETIVIRSNEDTRHYRVIASYETVPDDLAPLYATNTEILTLITCGDYDFLANSYQSRLIVVAERI